MECIQDIRFSIFYTDFCLLTVCGSKLGPVPLWTKTATVNWILTALLDDISGQAGSKETNCPIQ